MRTTSRIGSLALLAVAAALAVSASGCIIDNNSSPGSCYPDLYVDYEIVAQSDNTLVTCAQAGADTVVATVYGVDFPQACPASSSSGSILVQLDQTGSYPVSIALFSGSTNLSQTPTITVPVDCSGSSSTPVAQLGVNL